MAVVIAEAATGDINIVEIVRDIGDVAEALAYGECPDPFIALFGLV